MPVKASQYKHTCKDKLTPGRQVLWSGCWEVLDTFISTSPALRNIDFCPFCGEKLEVPNAT